MSNEVLLRLVLSQCVGKQVIWNGKKYPLLAIDDNSAIIECDFIDNNVYLHHTNPILRTFDQMSEEEIEAWQEIHNESQHSPSDVIELLGYGTTVVCLCITPHETAYLLSIGIDVFDLIGIGLAVKEVVNE